MLLHNCRQCGEAWSTGYILRHPAQFRGTIHQVEACPGCTEPLPGIPGETTNREIATVFVVRCSADDYIVVRDNGVRHCGSLRDAMGEICAS